VTLKMGQIGGGQPVQTYTGMMNAAPKVVAGIVSEKAHLAGLLAFTSATTNNVTVNVDFASWVRKADTNPLVLGNVSGAPPYTESVFRAVENRDGSVGIHMSPFSAATESSSGLDLIATAYRDWRDGKRSTKPFPKRCAGCKLLNHQYGEAIPSGKCDNFLAVEIASLYDGREARPPNWASGGVPWTSSGINGTAAHNSNMYIEAYEATNPVATYQMCVYDPRYTYVGQCSYYLPILSETYVSTWDAPF